MKRFWLFLLVFVLPLQMSWAAAHYCDESAGLAHATKHETAATVLQDQHEPAAGELLADGCCVAAHGFHGFHAALAQEPSALQILTLASTPQAAPLRVARTRFAERHERPQWPAA